MLGPLLHIVHIAEGDLLTKEGEPASEIDGGN